MLRASVDPADVEVVAGRPGQRPARGQGLGVLGVLGVLGDEGAGVGTHRPEGADRPWKVWESDIDRPI